MTGKPSQWHFEVDRYLNPFLPPSLLHRLPRPVSHFLGHRTETKPRPQLGNLHIILNAFIGVFCSIIVIERVTREVSLFQNHGAPIITGSFGAAAVLEFYSIDSPLSQPRNAVVGQILSSVVGTAVCKLFALSSSFESIRWLGGGLACACATAVMALAGTVHPPAGATALLAVVDNGAVELGWLLIPVVMLGCVLMQCIALLINNIQRRFPAYWWSPEETGSWWRRHQVDVEADPGAKLEPQLTQEGSHRSAATLRESADETHITLTPGSVVVPQHIYLTPEERLLLEAISQRL